MDWKQLTEFKRKQQEMLDGAATERAAKTQKGDASSGGGGKDGGREAAEAGGNGRKGGGRGKSGRRGGPKKTQNKDGWEELFSFNSTCDDDTGQYPGKDEVVGHFMERHAAAGDLLASIDDAVLAAELPDEHRMKARMGTVGNMVNFLLVAHPAIHLGQLSAWRRALGYGDALSRR